MASCRHGIRERKKMTRPDRLGKKTVQATVTREEWKTLRRIVTDTERPATDLIAEAIGMLDKKYPAKPQEQPTEPTGRKRRPRDRSPG
jgi:hypothetical protein